jgi:hypothetical protein
MRRSIEDNSQLVDLSGYKVYYGTILGVYGTPITVAADTTYQVIRFPTPGTWFVQISAYNSTAQESALSDPLTLVVPGNTYAPNVHNGLTQTGGGNFTLATPTLSGSGKLGIKGSGAISPPLTTASGNGGVGHSGSGSMATSVSTVVAVGFSSATGIPGLFARYTAYSGGQANTFASRLIYDVAQAIDGDGALSPSLPTVSGISSRGLEVMGSPVEIEAAEATVEATSATVLAVTGDGSFSVDPVTLASVSVLGHPGTGTLTVSNVTLGVTAKIGYVSEAAVGISVPAAIGYGQANLNGVPPTPTYTWSGTISVPSVTASGVGTKNKTGATYFGGGAFSPDLAMVEATANITPRLALSTAIALSGPTVYLDGESELHLTIIGTGSVSPLAHLLSGSARRPLSNVGSGVFSPPPMVIVGRSWGPAFVETETWSPASVASDPWTPVNTQSENWNG